MPTDNGQQLAMSLLCLLCLAPFVLGGIAGAWLQRRIQATGSLARALIPGFVIKLLERYQ